MDFYSQFFLNKHFKVESSLEKYPNGLICEEWKHIVQLYETCQRFEIPYPCFRLMYEVIKEDDDGRPTEVKVLKIDFTKPTNR